MRRSRRRRPILELFTFKTWLALIAAIVLIAMILTAAQTRAFGQEAGGDGGGGVSVVKVAVMDKNGYPEVNGDGTYYRGDRVRIEYFGADIVDATVRTDLDVLDNGNGFFLIGSSARHAYGQHDITVTLSISIGDDDEDGGGFVRTVERSLTYDLVPFRPEYEMFFYPVLKDSQTYTYQDRQALIIDYKGSRDQLGFLHPERRLFLNDTKWDSYVQGYDAVMQDAPLQPAEQEFKFQIATGFNITKTWHVLDLSRDDGDNVRPGIFIPVANVTKYYYDTSVRNQTAIDGGLLMNVTADFHWEEKDDYRDSREFPVPAIRLDMVSRNLVVHTVPQQEVEVRIEPMYDTADFQSADNKPNEEVADTPSYYNSISDYFNDKGRHETKSDEVGRLAAEDVNPPGFSVTRDARIFQLDFDRPNIDVLLWYMQFGELNEFSMTMDTTVVNRNFMDVTMDDMLSGAHSPVAITVVFKGVADDPGDDRKVTKFIPDFNFGQRYVLNLDTRQEGAELDFMQVRATHGASIKLPWRDPVKIEITYDNGTERAGERAGHLSRCTDNMCTVQLNEFSSKNVTAVAYNEWGGIARGKLQLSENFDPNYNTYTPPELVEQVKISAMVLLILFAGGSLLRKFVPKLVSL